MNKGKLAIKDNNQWMTSPVNHLKFLREIQVKTEVDAIQSNELTIAAMRRISLESTEAILNLAICALVKFFNVGKTMDDWQIKGTVSLILKEYYFLNLIDIRLCFDRLMAGHYGKAFDRIDGQIILMALNEYSARRAEIAEAMTLERHHELKALPDTEMFYVKIDGLYSKTNEDESIETVPDKESGTYMNYDEAYKWKATLGNAGVKIIIERVSKPEIGLIDWMKVNAPQMLKPNQTINYEERKAKLDEIKRGNMSEFDKCNATRMIIGMEPLTEAEFNERAKADAEQFIESLKSQK